MERGDSVELLCEATGDPAPEKIWLMEDGHEIGNNTGVSAVWPNGSAVLFHVGWEEKSKTEFRYECLVWNIAGFLHNTTTVYIKTGRVCVHACTLYLYHH